MARSSKWITGCQPDDPLTSVARRALQQRLEVLQHWLPLAARRFEEDCEYVHRLRVATRRADVAIRLFRKLASRKRARRMSKRLRRIRLASGEARDLDVLSQRVTESGAVSARVLEQVHLWRQSAQQPLNTIDRRMQKWRLHRKCCKLIWSVRWRGKGKEPRFDTAARAALGPAARRFIRSASGDLSDVTAIHRMRIHGKQLRYAIETLAGAFPDSLRKELYP